MTQPTYQPPPNYPQPVLPNPARPPASPKRWRAMILPVGVGLIVGLIAGVVSGLGDTSRPSAAPAVTVTATTTATIHVTSPSSAPTTSEPTTEPSTATFTPHKGDFVIGLKILRKQCFGSAGCNIDYRIKPLYVGSQTLPDTGTIEVTYRVTGGDEGANENTFTIEGGTVTYDKTESTGTASSGAKLKVKVIDASYSE